MIILDSTLKNWTGHSADYDFSIAEELRRRGQDCIIHAHKSTTLAIPTFRLRGLDYKGKWVILFTNLFHFLDLVRIRPTGTVLICDFSSRTSLAYALWLALHRKKALKVFIVIHSKPRGSFWFLFRFHSITLAALNQPIKDICQVQTKLKCIVFPTPQTRLGRSDHSGIRISFLGLGTKAKGFDKLINELDLLKGLSLTIQCNQAPKDLRNKLLSKPVRVIEGELDREQFFNLLCESDILLFPYQPSAYKYIQSGVFTQALCLGKIAIVTGETLLADELFQHGSGVIYDYSMPGALAESIWFVVNNFTYFKKKAQAKKDAYYKLHNVKRYVDLLEAE